VELVADGPLFELFFSVVDPFYGVVIQIDRRRSPLSIYSARASHTPPSFSFSLFSGALGGLRSPLPFSLQSSGEGRFSAAIQSSASSVSFFSAISRCENLRCLFSLPPPPPLYPLFTSRTMVVRVSFSPLFFQFEHRDTFDVRHTSDARPKTRIRFFFFFSFLERQWVGIFPPLSP